MKKDGGQAMSKKSLALSCMLAFLSAAGLARADDNIGKVMPDSKAHSTNAPASQQPPTELVATDTENSVRGPENIKTEQEMADYLRELTDRKITTEEQSYTVRSEFRSIANKLRENPNFASNRVLKALTAIALNSPYSDIAKGAFRHPGTPAQDVSLRATRLIGDIARLRPDLDNSAISELEHLMESSLDWEVRDEALMTVWIIGEMKGPYNVATVAALSRQASANSAMSIRIHAREQILGISREHNEALEPALIAFEAATNDDPEPEARAGAYAMLGNAVQTVTELSEDQLKSLQTVFQQAATHTGEDSHVLESAAYGLGLVQKRLATPGHPAPYPYPKH